MRSTEVWQNFKPTEQDVIRQALRKNARKRSIQEVKLVRQFWQLHKQRARDGLCALDNHRINPEYRAWLKKRKLPQRFSRKTYDAWRREVISWAG